MSWVTVLCPDGPYELNAEGVARLIRSYAYARALDANSTVQTQKHVFGPNISIVDADWNKVPGARDEIIRNTSTAFFLRMSTGMRGRDGIAYLEGLASDRDEYTNSVKEKQKAALSESMANIAQSVHFGENAVTALTVIRDAAAETELVEPPLSRVQLPPPWRLEWESVRWERD